MSYLDSGYTSDDDFDEKEKDIDQEIENCRKILDEGVLFRSHVDGSEHLLTPEHIVEIQEALGTDVAMVLDDHGRTPILIGDHVLHALVEHPGLEVEARPEPVQIHTREALERREEIPRRGLLVRPFG